MQTKPAVYRVRVTELDAFASFRSEDWMTWDKLRAQLDGTEEKPDHVHASNAVHAFLEEYLTVPETVRSYARRGLLWHHEPTGYNVDARSALSMLVDGTPWSFGAVAEVPFTAPIETFDGETVVLRGKCDVVGGLYVCDYKVKTRRPTLPAYENSYQWRAYLYALGVERFQYRMAQGEITTRPTGARVVEIVSEPVEEVYNTYEDIRADLVRMASDFVDTVRVHAPELLEARTTTLRDAMSFSSSFWTPF